MKQCPTCKQLLKNSDAHCPYCAGEKPLPGRENAAGAPSGAEDKKPFQTSATAQPSGAPTQPDPPATVHDLTATLEIPLFDLPQSTQPHPSEQAVPVSAVVSQPAVGPAAAGPQGMTVEIPLVGEHDDSAIDALDGHGDEEEGASLGYIEREIQQLGEDDEDDDGRTQSLGKLGVTLIVLLVLAALFFGYSLYKKLSAPTDAISADVIANYVEGNWMSGEFIYNEDADSQRYVEYLVLHEDGTFQLQVLVPDKTNPDGYLTGEWIVETDYSGTYTIDAEANILILQFTLDGETVALNRHIVAIDQNTLTLREYYDNLMTDYFDVTFTRVD